MGRPRGEAMTGAQVRRIRRRLRLTQVQLAALLGVTENTLRRWELGYVGLGAPVARLIQYVASSAPKRAPAKRQRPKTKRKGRIDA